jgi:hypothetical protein
MLETTTTPHFSDEDVLEVIREELRAFFKTYNNESAAFSSFERFSGLNRKTLKGFIDANRRPYPSTLISFYKWYYKTEKLNEIATKLRPEVMAYLASNGLDVAIEKKDITAFVTRSSIHYEIYLLTEDQQVIKRSDLERDYGLRGLDALNDLLIENIVLAIDENTFTTGRIRAEHNLDYYEKSSAMISGLIPWSKIKNKEVSQRGMKLSLGSLVITPSEYGDLNKLFGDFNKRLCDIHAKAMKKPLKERQTMVYSVMGLTPSMIKGE